MSVTCVIARRNLTALIFLICGVLVTISTAYAGQNLVAFLSSNQIMVQDANGGKPRPATPAEKSRWLAVGARKHNRSPDGRFLAESAKDLDEGFFTYDSGGIKILDARSRRSVMSLKDTYNMVSDANGLLDEMMFRQWLPDSRHVAVKLHCHVSSNEEYAFGVFDIRSRKFIRFNGWLAPDGRTAIVPEKEGLARDTEWSDVGDKRWSNGDLSYYVVRLSSKDIRSYRFSNCEKRRINLNGNPFPLTVMSPVIQFSPDSRWAITTGRYSLSWDTVSGPEDAGYLISLATGKVQPLSGTRARFIH